MKQFNVMLLVSLIICLINLSCEKCSECPDDNDQSNHPPVISDILFNPNPPFNGFTTVFLTAVATDNEGDSLSYYWNVSSGSLTSSTSTLYGPTINPARWLISEIGTHVVKIIVSDGVSLDSMSVNVVVN